MSECYECGSETALEEHHTSYDPERTVMLCRTCHRQVHGNGDHRLEPDDQPPKTTIQVSQETRERLEFRKVSDGESCDNVIERLLDDNGGVFTKSEIEEIARRVASDEIREVR
jgi:hypothetical protein